MSFSSIRPRPPRLFWVDMIWFPIWALIVVLLAIVPHNHAEIEVVSEAQNNWAVIVSASRFWFNYRHMANALSLYRTVKRLGVPDENIILMLADDVACNPRNVWPARVINSATDRLDLYADNVEVDYRGYEVTVERLVRVLTNRLPAHIPSSKRLLTDAHSRILIYMTGHGGDEFLKFQDAEELGAQDIADALRQMHEQQRFKEVLFMVDTCQANTLPSKIDVPGVVAAGSSARGENSYSHHADRDLGVAVIDRWTHFTLDFLERVRPGSSATLHELFAAYNANAGEYGKIGSTPGVHSHVFGRPLEEAKLVDFFGAERGVAIQSHIVSLNRVRPTVPKHPKPTRSVKKQKTDSSYEPAKHVVAIPINTLTHDTQAPWFAWMHTGLLGGILFLIFALTR